MKTLTLFSSALRSVIARAIGRRFPPMRKRNAVAGFNYPDRFRGRDRLSPIFFFPVASHLNPLSEIYFFSALLEGNRTVAEPGSVISPRWFSPQHSMSTRCSPSRIYFLGNFTFHPMGIADNIETLQRAVQIFNKAVITHPVGNHIVQPEILWQP